MNAKDQYRNIVGWEMIVAKAPPSFQEWFKGEREFIAANIRKDAKVLEVGSGDGRSIRDVLQVTQNITGVDHDVTAVEHARENLKEYPSAKIIQAEGTALPFEDKSFDYITCIGTFANLGDQRSAILAEMVRVLKDDGGIIVSSYSEDALPERLKEYNRINVPIVSVSEHGTVIFDDFGKEGVSEQFSASELEEIFKSVNLKMVKIQKAGIGYVCLLSKVTSQPL